MSEKARQSPAPPLAATWAVIALIAAVLAVTAAPYIYAQLSTPAGLVYTGWMFDVPDHAQYWSWVVASRHGLFISNTMTPEPNPATFLNPMMWLLARVQRATGLSFPWLFQWWRIAAVVLLVPTVWLFVGTFTQDAGRRATALWIALFGSGLGWVLVVSKKFTASGDVLWPNDLYTVEPNTFWAILGYPFIAFADAFLLATMLGVWLVWRRKHRGGWLLAAAAATCLSLSHAYDLITVYVVLSAYGLVVWIRNRQLPARLVAVGGLVAICSGPIALYYQWLTTRDELWRHILGQYTNAGVWTPPHVHLIILMGAPLLLAAVTLWRTGGWTEERRFLAVWAGVSLVLIYLPVPYQIKLLTGWQFPLAILAADAWHERVVPALDGVLSRRLVAAALVLLVSSTNLYLFAWRFIDLRRHGRPYYMHQDDRAALDWLAANAHPSDVVMAADDVGALVPNYGATRAYLAHWAMTDRFFERRANVATFFDPGTPPEWRAHFLATEPVTLVLRTAWPGAADRLFEPTPESGLDLVFARPEARIYRVRARRLDSADPQVRQ